MKKHPHAKFVPRDGGSPEVDFIGARHEMRIDPDFKFEAGKYYALRMSYSDGPKEWEHGWTFYKNGKTLVKKVEE